MWNVPICTSLTMDMQHIQPTSKKQNRPFESYHGLKVLLKEKKNTHRLRVAHNRNRKLH